MSSIRVEADAFHKEVTDRLIAEAAKELTAVPVGDIE